MKKFLLSILSVFVFAAGAFAGGGGYYDDQFPRHSYIAQDLTNEYVNDHGKLKTYVVYDCTAVLGNWNVEDFVKDEKRKVKVPAGTEVKILSVDDEIKFCHDFDSPVVGDENYGVVYYDYVCKFTVNGKAYTGVIPGVYVSTDSQSVTVDDGTTYTLMCIWTASADLYYSDLRDCNSLEEVGYKIKELQNSVRILEAMGKSQ